jgi:hypothetical protein
VEKIGQRSGICAQFSGGKLSRFVFIRPQREMKMKRERGEKEDGVWWQTGN